MSLPAGTRIGPYEIVSPLGAGGMGEVYRAHDSRLGRDVALKVLAAAFRSDRERLARFEREARALAALNHPHIAQIFGFEESGGLQALAMELVEGQTLEAIIDGARNKGGGLTIARALEIGRQLAAAIEAAHTNGVLHRDLKPANIRIDATGAVKVLDFGLAAVREDPTSPGSMLVTGTAFTERGAIIGTPAYMSPEQARGEMMDRRTDVWAFGCVLFEMLSGTRAFDGRTSSDAMAAVLTREPTWSQLPPDSPSAIVRLVRRCLHKEPDRRLRDLGDARLEIEEAVEAPFEDGARARPPLWHSAVLSAAIFVVGLAAGVAGWRWYVPTPALTPLRRFVLPLAVDRVESTLNEAGIPFSISRDGGAIVFSAGSQEGSQLFLRSLSGTEARPLAGTLGAQSPFFSADGRSIGFVSTRKLMRMPASGGPMDVVSDVAGSSGGATWTEHGIFLSSIMAGAEGIARVDPQGGTPVTVTRLDRTRESAHLWPDLLPDGKTLIYTVRDVAGTATQVVAQSLADGTRTVLIPGASQARYVAGGHLLYAQSGRVLATRFDPRGLAIAGSPIPILENVWLSGDGTAHVDVADESTLVHVEGMRTDQRALSWVDRQGRRTPIPIRAAAYSFPALSPDRTQLTIWMREGNQRDHWLYQFATGSLAKTTFVGRISNAIWTPDGESLTYVGPHTSGSAIYLQGATPSANVSPLVVAPMTKDGVVGMWPGSWTSDGRYLAYMKVDATTRGDIWVFDRQSQQDRPVVNLPETQWGARISPDGRWLAFVSNESGRWQVYLQPFPGPGGRVQISSDGGTEVVWARDGRELFYRQGPRMIALAIEPAAKLAIGQTTVLFEAALAAGQPGLPNYDVAADGRFIMVEHGPEERVAPPLNVTINWTEWLKREP